MCREMTEEEVRREFLEYVWTMIDYWEYDTRTPARHEKLSGLALTLLAAIDGESELPAFKLIPISHPENKKWHQERGENWYPETDVDIAGPLHEQLYQVGKG